MSLTMEEQTILAVIRQKLMEDRQINPFLKTERWYTRFERVNNDGVSLIEAPLNTPLIVTTEKVGTLYRNERGTSIIRGSLVVKVSINELLCVDAYTLGLTPYGGTSYSLKGVFKFGTHSLYGKVKELKKVKLVD